MESNVLIQKKKTRQSCLRCVLLLLLLLCIDVCVAIQHITELTDTALISKADTQNCTIRRVTQTNISMRCYSDLGPSFILSRSYHRSFHSLMYRLNGTHQKMYNNKEHTNSPSHMLIHIMCRRLIYSLPIY